MYNIEQSMARLCNRLMENAQSSLTELTYILDEMAYNTEQSGQREDIEACMKEIKEKVKSGVAEHWAVLNKWAEHFDGITPPDEEQKETDGTTPPVAEQKEPDGEQEAEE